MISGISKFLFRLQVLLLREEGQDLVEYALVIALIAFGATAALNGITAPLKNGFLGFSSGISSAYH
jgi:pilus assembly protein Flp/PilA